MRLLISSLLVSTLLCLTGCSGNTGPTKSDKIETVPAGEKATVGHLAYNIVDSQILQQLGEDPSPRVPHDRFILVQIAVTNTSNVDNPIPAIELIADSGKTYDELPDGSGITNWLGVVRHVGPGQTERGEVAFDAPAAHYKLKFSDESADTEVLADLPLSYSHEKMSDTLVPTTELPEAAPASAPAGTQKPK
jgi:hypothetical protein